MTFQSDFDKKKTLADGSTNFPDFLIREYGCYFLSLCFLLKSSLNSKEEIRKKYFKSLEQGLIDYDCYVKNPCPLAGYLRVQLIEIEKYSPSLSHKALIGRFRLESAPEGQKSHFVVLDKSFNVLWDPIRGGSEHVRKGQLTDLRVFS